MILPVDLRAEARGASSDSGGWQAPRRREDPGPGRSAFGSAHPPRVDRGPKSRPPDGRERGSGRGCCASSGRPSGRRARRRPPRPAVQHVVAVGLRRFHAVAPPHHHRRGTDLAFGDPAHVVLVEPGRDAGRFTQGQSAVGRGRSQTPHRSGAMAGHRSPAGTVQRCPRLPTPPARATWSPRVGVGARGARAAFLVGAHPVLQVGVRSPGRRGVRGPGARPARRRPHRRPAGRGRGPAGVDRPERHRATW